MYVEREYVQELRDDDQYDSELLYLRGLPLLPLYELPYFQDFQGFQGFQGFLLYLLYQLYPIFLDTLFCLNLRLF